MGLISQFQPFAAILFKRIFHIQCNSSKYLLLIRSEIWPLSISSYMKKKKKADKTDFEEAYYVTVTFADHWALSQYGITLVLSVRTHKFCSWCGRESPLQVLAGRAAGNRGASSFPAILQACASRDSKGYFLSSSLNPAVRSRSIKVDIPGLVFSLSTEQHRG